MARGSASRPSGRGRGNTRQSGGRSVVAQNSTGGSNRSAVSSIGARTASRSPSRPIQRPATIVVMDRVLEHVLKIIGFDRTKDPDHPVFSALHHASCTTIMDLFGMRRSDVETLTYIDTSVQPAIRKHLPIGNQTRLLAPQGYREYIKTKTQINMKDSDWLFTTDDEIKRYLMSSDYMYFNNSNGTSTIPGPAPGVVKTNSSIEAFKKSMKREPSQFKTFSDKRYWATWHLQFVATAQAQDLDEITDASYVPSTQEEKDLFNLKQKYLFSVFTTVLQTDEGKALVRNQQQLRTFDAQSIFAELTKYHTNSTQSELISNEIMQFITTFRLGKQAWKGKTSVSFIAYFVEQLRLYDELTFHQGTILTEPFKRAMLDNAVHGIDDLRQVRITQSTLCQQSGQQPSFQQYLDLLNNAAVVYDSYQQSGSMRRPDTNTQRVYATHGAYDTFGLDDVHDIGQEYDLEHTEFEIDAPLSTITAFAAQQRRATRPTGPPDPSTRLPDSVFAQLSLDDKRTWARLSENARRVILALNKNGESSHTSQNMSGITSANRRVLMAEHYSVPTEDGELSADTLPPDTPSTDTTELLAMMTNGHHPGDVRRLLSNSSANPSTIATPTRKIHAMHTYSVARSQSTTKRGGALIDRGANGGLAGIDCRVITKSPDRFVNIEGIDHHRLPHVPIVSCGAYTVSLNHGPVIVVFHQFAGMQRGQTIISSAQLESYSNVVNERSRTFDPKGQLITTNDGFEFPLHIRQGLPYLDLRPYTDLEWDSLPHVIMTSDVDWDPATMDYEFPLSGQEASLDSRLYQSDNHFTVHGEYSQRTLVASARQHPQPTIALIDNFSDVEKHVTPNEAAHVDFELSDTTTTTSIVVPSPHLAKDNVDPESLRQYFAFLPLEVVSRTMDSTTQLARVTSHGLNHRFYKSPFPALNVARRNEDLLTDIVYSDTPAIDDGSTSAAVYSGRTSHVLDVFGMKSDKQFVNTLEDIIRDRGAPTRLLSDFAVTLRSSRVLDVLRALCIGNWSSEPHRQNQNTMERRYQTLKRITNLLLDRSGCPASCWLLCMQYVALVLNCTACKSLNWAIPLQILLGVTIDVSPLLRFYWYQPVLYNVDNASFPSESHDSLGYFVGVATHCGHAMTFKVLSAASQRVLIRSQVRAADGIEPRLPLTTLLDGEPPSRLFIQSKSDEGRPEQEIDPESGEIEQPGPPSMVLVDTSELIGKTFLLDGNQDDGTKYRARIVEAIDNHQHSHANSKEHTKFRVSINNDSYEEILTYGEIMDHINRDEEQGDIFWKFKRISGHQGPLSPTDEDYNGSTYNVRVEWENGEITFEPLSIIAADDPVSCAIYARENNLLDTPGWKQFKKIARREKVLLRAANQAKLRSFSTAPRYKYGFEIPRNYAHALQIDSRNKNTKWQDATKLEFDQLDEYETFEDGGDGKTDTPPKGYTKINVHLVFDVKHDGRHKVRCVAGGHLTEIPLDSVYSGVVSLRGLRIMLFLSELNRLEVWATDIGNAYLEARTKETIYIIGGPEFGSRHGRILIIRKALYGLRSSGKRWHERFADCLRDEGFSPCKTEPDVWIRPTKENDCYEMIAVYVDDLAIGMKDPESFLEILKSKYKFKLKGSGPISFHLGCGFSRDKDGVLVMDASQYIDRMATEYERMFGCKPHTRVTSPLERNDHPETDDSELLDEDGIQRYQSIIGSLQWAVSIGRFDITTAVMTMSGFRSAPRKGHLERAKRIVCYLFRFKSAQLRYRTHEPDLSDVNQPIYDWADSVYGTVQEEVPRDIPRPLGKAVVTVSYVDANLLHCLNTGRSVTGVLHFLNGTMIDWYSKKMNTVETATYGAEFVSARTCIEQLVDLRNTLRYMGVPIREKSYIFGDNESVVNSATQPHAKLHKRHNALSFHRVREAIASGVYIFNHIPGENNPADIVSKHWGYNCVWHMLKTISHVDGETINAPGRKDKDGTTVAVANHAVYRAHRCEIQYGRLQQETATEVFVQRDRGVSAFWSEWILMEKGRQHVNVSMMMSYHECCEEESQMPLKFTGFQEVSLSGIERDQPQHEKSRALIYQRGPSFSSLYGRAGRVVTNAILLVNLENSNVQHGFSSNTWTISAPEEYWDRYNSTGNKSCHMILTPLVYISTTINVVK